MKIRIMKPTNSKNRQHKMRNWRTGDLLITITKEEVQGLKDCGDNYHKRLSEFLVRLEKYSCNGSFFYFGANEFGQLSEAPCLGDRQSQPYDEEKDEEGAPETFWFHNNYMCEDFTETLRDHRYVIFQKN